MNHLAVRRSLVDDVFNDFFQRSGLVPTLSGDGGPSVARARMDVIDRGDKFEIKVDLPGVTKDDINVTVEGARVTLQAESRKEKETKNGERVLHSERTVTSYARNFELPVEVTEDGADASAPPLPAGASPFAERTLPWSVRPSLTVSTAAPNAHATETRALVNPVTISRYDWRYERVARCNTRPRPMRPLLRQRPRPIERTATTSRRARRLRVQGSIFLQCTSAGGSRYF